jgi:DNA-binding transcriptional regulator YhcF (GntR family)
VLIQPKHRVNPHNRGVSPRTEHTPGTPPDPLADVTIDPQGSVAPYEQLRSQVAARVADGRLPSGTRLPTVRATATALGLAANTVAKAYRALETDGVVETEGRRGTFVASRHRDGAAVGPSGDGGQDGLDWLEEAVADVVKVARRRGMTLPETQRFVAQRWERH